MWLFLQHQISFQIFFKNTKSKALYFSSLHSRMVSSTGFHLVPQLLPPLIPASLWILKSISSTDIFLDTNSWSSCCVIINLTLFPQLAPSFDISSRIIGLVCSKILSWFFTMCKKLSFLVTTLGAWDLFLCLQSGKQLPMWWVFKESNGWDAN